MTQLDDIGIVILVGDQAAVHFATARVYYPLGRPCRLSGLDILCLQELAEAQGGLVSHLRLEGLGDSHPGRTIQRLRSKLGAEHIINERQHGYRLAGYCIKRISGSDREYFVFDPGLIPWPASRKEPQHLDPHKEGLISGRTQNMSQPRHANATTAA